MSPYILEVLGKQADEATRGRALETLELTGRLKVQRMSVVHELETIPRHPGDRRTVCDLQHDQFLPGKVVRREGDPPVEDAAMNEAYDNAGITYDFFEDVFGRRSIDGKDMRLLSSVHYPSITTTRSGTASKWCPGTATASCSAASRRRST